MTHHGAPCWYELTTPDAKSTTAFYSPLLGWETRNSGIPGMNYTIASRNGAMVAGLYQPDEAMPNFWMVYFAVTDCDAAAAKVKAMGGSVHVEPADIPETGRFAILADPQGAAFGILQPLGGQQGDAFDQQKMGHGNWQELSTSDPAAALAFYSELLGWAAGNAMDMGPMGSYQLISRNGTDIGGIMKLQGPGIPPNWVPFFGVDSIDAAMAQIGASGGTVVHGPQEVPGPAFICYAADPSGAVFALVGPR